MAKTTNNSTTNSSTELQSYKSGDVYTLKDRTIVSVMRGKDAESNRYYIELDGEPFPSHNKDGEEIESNSFSMSLLTLAKQIVPHHELFNMVFAMANTCRGTLNPALVGLLLQGCKITNERTFKEATDLRNTGNEDDTYGKDTWISNITSIKPNIGEITQQVLIKMIMNPETLVVSETPKKPSPKDLLDSIS